MPKESSLYAAERMALVLRVLAKEEPAAQIAHRAGVSGSPLNRWREQFIEGGAAHLAGNGSPKEQAREIVRLERQFAKRDQVMGERTIASRLWERVRDGDIALRQRDTSRGGRVLMPSRVTLTEPRASIVRGADGDEHQRRTYPPTTPVHPQEYRAKNDLVLPEIPQRHHTRTATHFAQRHPTIAISTTGAPAPRAIDRRTDLEQPTDALAHRAWRVSPVSVPRAVTVTEATPNEVALSDRYQHLPRTLAHCTLRVAAIAIARARPATAATLHQQVARLRLDDDLVIDGDGHVSPLSPPACAPEGSADLHTRARRSSNDGTASTSVLLILATRCSHTPRPCGATYQPLTQPCPPHVRQRMVPAGLRTASPVPPQSSHRTESGGKPRRVILILRRRNSSSSPSGTCPYFSSSCSSVTEAMRRSRSACIAMRLSNSSNVRPAILAQRSLLSSSIIMHLVTPGCFFAKAVSTKALPSPNTSPPRHVSVSRSRFASEPLDHPQPSNSSQPGNSSNSSASSKSNSSTSRYRSFGR